MLCQKVQRIHLFIMVQDKLHKRLIHWQCHYRHTIDFHRFGVAYKIVHIHPGTRILPPENVKINVQINGQEGSPFDIGFNLVRKSQRHHRLTAVSCCGGKSVLRQHLIHLLQMIAADQDIHIAAGALSHVSIGVERQHFAFDNRIGKRDVR